MDAKLFDEIVEATAKDVTPWHVTNWGIEPYSLKTGQEGWIRLIAYPVHYYLCLDDVCYRPFTLMSRPSQPLINYYGPEILLWQNFQRDPTLSGNHYWFNPPLNQRGPRALLNRFKTLVLDRIDKDKDAPTGKLKIFDFGLSVFNSFMQNSRPVPSSSDSGHEFQIRVQYPFGPANAVFCKVDQGPPAPLTNDEQIYIHKHPFCAGDYTTKMLPLCEAHTVNQIEAMRLNLPKKITELPRSVRNPEVDLLLEKLYDLHQTPHADAAKPLLQRYQQLTNNKKPGFWI